MKKYTLLLTLLIMSMTLASCTSDDDDFLKPYIYNMRIGTYIDTPFANFSEDGKIKLRDRNGMFITSETDSPRIEIIGSYGYTVAPGSSSNYETGAGTQNLHEDLHRVSEGIPFHASKDILVKGHYPGDRIESIDRLDVTLKVYYQGKTFSKRIVVGGFWSNLRGLYDLYQYDIKMVSETKNADRLIRYYDIDGDIILDEEV